MVQPSARRFLTEASPLLSAKLDKTEASTTYATLAETGGKAPMSLRGTLASRPAATAVLPGTMYFPTDQAGQARSNGAAWETVGGVPWGAYTPAVKTNGAALGLGNGTVTGRYQDDGKTIAFRARFTFGSTTTFNSAGPLTISIPVASVPLFMIGIGGGVIGGQVYSRFARLDAGLDLRIADAADIPVTNTAPGTWAAGNYIEVTGNYERA